jgi:predicted deacylase
MFFNIKTFPGKKVSQLIKMLVGREEVSLPFFGIQGRKTGPTLSITAGIHGTEYASIEAALRLGRTLSPDEICGRVVILPVINLPAFKKRTIYVGPIDQKNLNRVFPGKLEGTFSESLAYQISHEVISKSDFYIDLHGGDMNEALVPFVVCPQVENAEIQKVSLSMAKAFGIEVIAMSKTTGTAIFYACQAGVPAILAEAGGQGIWSEEMVKLHMKGVRRVMGHLCITHEKPMAGPSKVVPFPWLHSDYDGVFYPNVKIGDNVSEGQKVGSVCDFFGNELQAAISPVNGVVLFLVTSLAINKGDPLLGLGG